MSKPIIKVRDIDTGKIYSVPVAICKDTSHISDINSYIYLNNSLLQLTPYLQPLARLKKTYNIVNNLTPVNSLWCTSAYGDTTTIKFQPAYDNTAIGYFEFQPMQPWGTAETQYDNTPYFCLFANLWNDDTGTFDYTNDNFVCGYILYNHYEPTDRWDTFYGVWRKGKDNWEYMARIFAKAEPYRRYNEITVVEVGEETIDNTSDNIEQETETSLMGLTTMHTGEIDATNISNLSTAFSSDTTVNFLKSYFVDVFDAVTSLMIAPFEFEKDVDVTSATSNMNIFGYTVGSVEYHPAIKSIKRISCGTLHITPRYGNFMDFSPYSSYQLFVPYYGYVSLNADDVVGSDIELYYDVNISTGTFTAFIKCTRTKNDITLNSILYQLSGNMYYSIPLSRADFRTYYANLNSNMYSLGSTLLGAVGSAVSGNAMGVANSALAVANSVNNMSHEKVQLQRSGAVDTGSNLTTLRIPHMVISHANLSVSETLASENGYFSNVSYKLSELSGFTKVKSINLSIAGCTDNEHNQIESLLKSGVIL